MFSTFCCQFPFLADLFKEEDKNSVHTTKGVKVKAARPGVKPTNKQLRTTVGDKVAIQTCPRCCVYPYELTSVCLERIYSRTLSVLQGYALMC